MNLGFLSLFLLSSHLGAPAHSHHFVAPARAAHLPARAPLHVVAFRATRLVWVAPALPAQWHAYVHFLRLTDGVDLQREEARGGHTIAKHVGKSDGWLSDRLRREPNIPAASSYPDETTAERVIARTLADNQTRVQDWIARSGPRPNLVLEFHGDAPIGRVLSRGAEASHPSSIALIVLKWSSEHNYFVLTSYPTDHGWAASNAIKW
jgi:hypothetical protein